MKQVVLLLIGIFLFTSAISQKLAFFQKKRIYINQYAEKEFLVQFISLKKDVIKKKIVETFSSAGVLQTYQEIETPNWSAARELTSTNSEVPTLLHKRKYLVADIKPEEGRLLIYPWPFPIDQKKRNKSDYEKANTFFKDHLFSIEVPERMNLSFGSSSLTAGVLTLPLKFFLGAPDSVSAVQAAAGVGLYIGERWGHTKYVKLPNEKEFTTYQQSWSLNVALGVNKLDLDEKNTKDAGQKFKGSITSLSTAVTGGFHYRIFSVFLAAGFDHPLGKKGSEWSLKGKPWIGFGAGFEIL